MSKVFRNTSYNFTADAFSAAMNYCALVIRLILDTVVSTVSIFIINAIIFLKLTVKNKTEYMKSKPA